MSQVIALKNLRRLNPMRRGTHSAMVLQLLPLHRIQMETSMVQRIREVLSGSYHARIGQESVKALEEITREFVHSLEITPYRDLIDAGRINQLLDDYLGLLLSAPETSKEDAEQYTRERDYYFHHQQAVKDVAVHLKYFIVH